MLFMNNVKIRFFIVIAIISFLEIVGHAIKHEVYLQSLMKHQYKINVYIYM